MTSLRVGRGNSIGIQDLQSTTRIAELWMLQILGHQDGIDSLVPPLMW